ncbi:MULTISPECIES: substrate-binding domain-containing protein [unclassified Microbacterium]|uniref:LacI family DNA-binding transcriptional regulator n=1 Tax=unclassified Microbacterium TaxID=2609290 RepID=UPI00214CF2FB|nr:MULTISPECIES: substrate-binding domain-containing protein [unclassified Microbacterium]MCR2783460.1 substrate-binding domain-containing protein [Microbacterium sp. zg.B96]WIM17655.1 substrate-binding domain-containing protein [Microbacterium sp. zg-B96]
MLDVAARAGVSGQTVSRVVNASPRVDPVTRERVEQAMAELGYRPHRAARALRTGRTQTIGLVATTLATIGNSRMLQAVVEAAAGRGYAVTVVTLDAASGIGDAFARLRDQGVDGAIVLNEATAVVRDATAPADLALVVVDSPPDDRFAVVRTDHAAGARAATEHLLALGHATVWHLAGPEASFAAGERERGWRAALAGAGREVPPVVRGDWTAASGREAVAALGAPDAELTAIFAANDQMALGALRALADAGRRVPEEVSVVGFDDVADAADYRPPLTTVRQDFDELGAAAVAALVDAIEGAGHASVLLPATLVPRASTAPPPSAAPSRAPSRA